jgi:hydrogenase-4 component B
VPAVGALLALSAALSAACFVKAFGITFLGRPRTPLAAEAGETDRWSQAAMLTLAALCLLAGILPGYFIDALAPIIQTLTGTSLPRQHELDWLTIVPIAQSRSSYNGLLLFFFIALAAGLGAEVIHRWASAASRRAAAWDCGFPDASPATQYSAASLSQPIRRVFGSVVFRASEEVDLPPPGDSRPARLRVVLRDVPWEVLYQPTARLVGFAAERLNRLQFLTIRGYLTLVFGALVALLMVLTVWQ